MAEETASTAAASRRSGPLKRVQGVNIVAMREVFQVAACSLEPAERTNRQAVRDLMPEIYLMRHKDYSFAQIATLMTDCGFNLQPSTLRSYFHEFLVEREAECLKRMDEQILLLAEVKKETQGVEMSQISVKAAAIRAQQTQQASSTVDKVLGIGGNALGRVAAGVEAVAGVVTPPAVTPPTVNMPAAASPPGNVGAGAAKAAAPASAPSGADLLDGGSGGEVSGLAPKAGFDSTGDPVVPNLSAPTTAVETNMSPAPGTRAPSSGMTLKCKPIRADVKPVPKRGSVPEAVYADGLLEHPAITGLMLSRAERLYGALLEIDDGTGRVETVKEKVFRLKWEKPIPQTVTTTGAGFVKMDNTLFR